MILIAWDSVFRMCVVSNDSCNTYETCITVSSNSDRTAVLQLMQSDCFFMLLSNLLPTEGCDALCVASQHS